jgi:hypothetical protein
MILLWMRETNHFVVTQPSPPTPNGLEFQEDLYLDQFQNNFQHHNNPSPSEEINLPPELLTQYAQLQEKLHTVWESIEKAMASAYFVCQYQTKNWNLMNFIFFKLLIGYKG